MRYNSAIKWEISENKNGGKTSSPVTLRFQDGTGSTGSSVSNIYFKSDQEYLFLLKGKNYVLYQPENGTFIKQAGKKYQHTYVEALTEEFDKYVEKARLAADGSPIKEGSRIEMQECLPENEILLKKGRSEKPEVFRFFFNRYEKGKLHSRRVKLP